MRIAGSHLLAAPRQVVFDAIHDPAVLLASIPGCREARRVSPTEYAAELELRLPAVAGAFHLSVRVLDAVSPRHCQLDGRVDGRPGTIAGQALLQLTETGDGTRLDYTADGRIEGPLAWLDSSLVERLAATLLDQGFERLDRALAAAVASAATSEPEPLTTKEEASPWA
jgi:carbon monoxide dehydrogenase subunit G